MAGADPAPVVVPSLPEVAVLPDGTDVATPEVTLDYHAVVALEQQAKVEAGKRAAEAIALTHAAVAVEVKATDLAAGVDAKATALAAKVEEKATDLAAGVATEAAVQASDRQDKAVALAVALALRNAQLDQVLGQHAGRLDKINGSQERMVAVQEAQGTTLVRIESKVDIAAGIQDALTKRKWSNRTYRLAAVATTTTACALTLSLLAAFHII
jgi:hypothetical protein